MHSHGDLVCMSDRQLAAKPRQGITTEILGQDGLSEAPVPSEYVPMWRRHLSGLNGDPDLPWDWGTFGGYLDRRGGAAINMVILVGHGPIRLHAAGMDNRPVNASQLDVMCQVLDQALNERAIGFSTGLIYAPCVYGDTDELIALGRVVAKHDAFEDVSRGHLPRLCEWCSSGLEWGRNWTVNGTIASEMMPQYLKELESVFNRVLGSRHSLRLDSCSQLCSQAGESPRMHMETMDNSRRRGGRNGRW